MNRCLATPALVVTLAGIAAAQTIWTVGPGGFPDVNAALASASPGDTIRVLPGTYPTFQMHKGVTIRADVPGTVSCAGLFPNFVQVPAGERGHLVALQLSSVAVSGGYVSMDGCGVALGFLLVTANAVVTLQDCTFQSVSGVLSGSPAIGVMQSEITAIDSTIVGPGPGSLGGTLSPAISLTGSQLRGSHLHVQAGTGAGVVPGVAAIRGDATSSLWLSDSTVGADPGVCPIEVANGRHDRCVLTPNCATLPSGFVLGVHRVQRLQTGASFAVEFLAQPGMAVGVFAAPMFTRQLYNEIEQSLLLPASAAFALGNIVADPQGVAASTWSVPAGSMIVGQTLWLQGFSGFTYPLQASPLVGGVAR